MQARIYNLKSQHGKALNLSIEAAETGSRALGAEHPVVLEAQLEQARALAADNQNSQALKLVIPIHQLRSQRLGPDHPDTAQAKAFLDQLK